MIAAGIEAGVLSGWLGGYPLMRAMPNTPAMVGAGIAGLWSPAGIDEALREAAVRVLRAGGDVVEVKNESEIDLVGAIPGSGPAYVFRFMEALQKAGIKRGLSEAEAHALALGTVYGARRLCCRTRRWSGCSRRRR